MRWGNCIRDYMSAAFLMATGTFIPQALAQSAADFPGVKIAPNSPPTAPFLLLSGPYTHEQRGDPFMAVEAGLWDAFGDGAPKVYAKGTLEEQYVFALARSRSEAERFLQAVEIKNPGKFKFDIEANCWPTPSKTLKGLALAAKWDTAAMPACVAEKK